MVLRIRRFQNKKISVVVIVCRCLRAKAAIVGEKDTNIPAAACCFVAVVVDPKTRQIRRSEENRMRNENLSTASKHHFIACFFSDTRFAVGVKDSSHKNEARKWPRQETKQKDMVVDTSKTLLSCV